MLRLNRILCFESNSKTTHFRPNSFEMCVYMLRLYMLWCEYVWFVYVCVGFDKYDSNFKLSSGYVLVIAAYLIFSCLRFLSPHSAHSLYCVYWLVIGWIRLRSRFVLFELLLLLLNWGYPLLNALFFFWFSVCFYALLYRSVEKSDDFLFQWAQWYSFGVTLAFQCHYYIHLNSRENKLKRNG